MIDSEFNKGGVQIEEEPWSDRIETYIWDKQKEARFKSKEQLIEGGKNKKLYYILALPIGIIPLIMTFAVPLLEPGTNKEWIPQFFFMFTSILGFIAGFMNYGEKYGTNYAFSKDYQIIVSMIQLEMSRKKKYRRNADVFMNEIRLRMEFLNQESPNIETFFNCDISNGCCGFDNDYSHKKNDNDDKSFNNFLGLELV